ncbi:hypothetical protein FQA47_005208 [Oryzias melastigma]|uniref:Uncharacterized protein n=1 Tax=Oryzias melastigma TaxID=30732 RepID=A0A834F3J3_ORYME|nr:hypothetical protein FQA47_005208 [Oryzias melastigma]
MIKTPFPISCSCNAGPGLLKPFAAARSPFWCLSHRDLVTQSELLCGSEQRSVSHQDGTVWENSKADVSLGEPSRPPRRDPMRPKAGPGFC